MRRGHPLVRISLLGALVLAGAACGGDDAPPPCTAAGPTDTVELQDFAFSPTCIEAPAGSTIHLTNDGDAPHSFTVDGADASADVDAGETADVSLDGVAAGTYEVHCVYHPQMTATLNVV
jgi:plastocyanin